MTIGILLQRFTYVSYAIRLIDIYDTPIADKLTVAGTNKHTGPKISKPELRGVPFNINRYFCLRRYEHYNNETRTNRYNGRMKCTLTSNLDVYRAAGSSSDVLNTFVTADSREARSWHSLA